MTFAPCSLTPLYRLSRCLLAVSPDAESKANAHRARLDSNLVTALRSSPHFTVESGVLAQFVRTMRNDDAHTEAVRRDLAVAAGHLPSTLRRCLSLRRAAALQVLRSCAPAYSPVMPDKSVPSWLPQFEAELDAFCSDADPAIAMSALQIVTSQ